jgi:hypothetical protein
LSATILINEFMNKIKMVIGLQSTVVTRPEGVDVRAVGIYGETS